MRLKARAYVNLALEVIPLAQSAGDLRAGGTGSGKEETSTVSPTPKPKP